MKTLTTEEKELLQDMVSRYAEYIDTKIDAVGDFIWLAHQSGDIASTGEKYTENIKFWEVRDNIRQYLRDIKISANQLISKIINQ